MGAEREPAPLLSGGGAASLLSGNPRFKRELFLTACETGVPVLPMVISYRQPSGLIGILKRRPCLTLKILLRCILPSANKRQQTVELMDTVYDRMNTAYWN
ncbi:MAG: hypothetical protein ACLUOI_19695 [Eisenbergiella sp.]